ncbi:hypothetical protein LSAT2_026626 [Lamellibrachia satsuma]|nr:hypothetical protein LSAT2_026626 [Lamellibrachia satsuma]
MQRHSDNDAKVPSGHSGTPSASQCTQPPAMDPDKQICVGGVIYTIPAPECGGEVHYCCGHAILPRTGHWKPQSPEGSLKPLNTADLKPMNTADLKPMNTADLKPMNTADLKPMNTAHLKPMNTADLKPMNTADLKPMNTADLFRPMYAAAQRVVPMSQRVMPMSVAETPEPTRKPVTKCGSSPYDADKFICCSGRLYPSIYICCDGQVQGAPIKPACCNKFAFSRLTHKCVAGRLKPHY